MMSATFASLIGRHIRQQQEILDGLAETQRGEHARMATPAAISEFRERSGLLPSQFSALLGVPLRKLQEWEQGRWARTLLMSAKIHGCSSTLL